MPSLHVCLFEDAAVRHLEPLSLTRHVSDLRLGMHTVAEMHERVFGPSTISYHARASLAAVTGQEHHGALVNALPEDEPLLLVNGRYVPTPGEITDLLLDVARDRNTARVVRQGDDIVAAWLTDPPPDLLSGDALELSRFESLPVETVEGARMLSRVWDLVSDVEGQITSDFALVARRGEAGAVVHHGAVVAGTDFFLGEGATVLPGAVINALDGPVWMGEGALVEENAVIRGPCYVGEGATIKAGARIDGCAIGERSKIGGEVHASVVHSLSGKPHDGYLGNSYLGRWCNLGADTNTSNLKNDYGEVSMFDAVAQDFVPTGRRFLGLIMGDHSKSSINFMFNTGTVVGVFCNLFGSGFPPRHIPSFSWGGEAGLTEYRLEKAMRVAEAVMARRRTELTGADREMLAAVFEDTRAARERLAS